jgi:probable phosphoglycerate mutase
VTHKAVGRAIYALATGWPMIGKPPTKLRPNCAHVYALAEGGRPSVERLNVSLEG